MPEYFEANAPYRQWVDNQQPAKAVDEALSYLGARQAAVGAQQYQQDHKGTPFYILGYSAFACHDYTSASLYFDAAVEADLKYHQGNFDTAALRFIQIRHAPNENLLARDIIAMIEARAQALLDDYNTRLGHLQINMPELRSRFFESILKNGPAHRRILLTAFISFVAEWGYRARQIQLVSDGSREPFFLHLLRGCILFESLLKSAPGGRPLSTMEKALQHYKKALGLRGQLRLSAKRFDDVASKLAAAMDVDCSIYTCAQTRNTLGHNLAWATMGLTPQAYDLLVKNISASCLHAISVLYP